MKIANKLAIAGIGTLLSIGAVPARAETMTRDQVIGAGEKLTDTQLGLFHHGGLHWVDGVMWAGVMDFSKVSTEKGYAETILKRLGGKKGELVSHGKDEPHHADDFCVSQTMLGLSEDTDDTIHMAETRRRLDLATEHILSQEMSDKAARVMDLHWQEGLTWYWCDALFMAAPVHARLSAMTGDPKYLEAMHTEWKRTSDLLYDEAEQLYFRDKTFLTKKTKHGNKVFWARGNGWVMGAFARTLPWIPKNDPKREWYINQFKEMAAKLASIQRPDGTWSPSLLDYEHFPYSETTGTALNTFAMTWGINNGILEEMIYRPVVEKAWAAMLAARTENGLMGYAQGVGAEPAGVEAENYMWYGNGAFLMAATQLAQLAEKATLDLPPPPTLTAKPPKEKK